MVVAVWGIGVGATGGGGSGLRTPHLASPLEGGRDELGRGEKSELGRGRDELGKGRGG